MGIFRPIHHFYSSVVPFEEYKLFEDWKNTRNFLRHFFECKF